MPLADIRRQCLCKIECVRKKWTMAELSRQRIFNATRIAMSFLNLR